jgi:hypothetical protein
MSWRVSTVLSAYEQHLLLTMLVGDRIRQVAGGQTSSCAREAHPAGLAGVLITIGAVL